MRKFNKKISIIYVLLITFILIVSLKLDFIIKNYSFYINPIFWMSLALIAFLLFRKDERYKNKFDKLQIISIIVLTYIIIYFLSGLLFDFVKNIYSTEITSILKNIWMFVLIIVFKEYVREKLIKNSGTNFLFTIFIVILFVLSDIEIFGLNYYLTSFELFFKYFCSTIFPIICFNVLCTHLVNIGGFKLSLYFRLPIILVKLVVPVQPDLDWFLIAVYESILCFVTYLIIDRYHVIRTSRSSKRILKSSRTLPKFLLVFGLLFFCLFVAGIFIYKPIAVMSGSMEPIFKRGDILIVEKLTDRNDKKLEISDIIEYNLDDRIVLHRIIRIEEKNNEVVYITKGDNNDVEDPDPVSRSQVVGIIKFNIKYIGYPSVLLNEYFKR